VFAGHTGPSALELLAQADIPCGAVRPLEDVVDHVQLAARDRWTIVSTPKRSGAGPESPFNLRGVPRKGGRVPGLGQDTASILAELDVLPQLHPQQLLLPSMSARPVWRCR
jgi:itaconate CoA-transferase